ncbi:hypothetical protein J437_LFUL009953 [Ladona fulva]|uniref:Uncharacterized protein n=1 Tax=Ladona fulva TaxID=123851 RepID=A0A8K0P4B5_LADFU|nr:hypothetical protein J437_LFUL009953 [Ladona fulva]
MKELLTPGRRSHARPGSDLGVLLECEDSEGTPTEYYRCNDAFFCIVDQHTLFGPLLAFLDQVPAKKESEITNFIANILMLIGAFQCHQFQTHLSVEETEADGRSVLNLMRTYLFDQMALLISNALPGTEEMEQWNNMQSTFSCCGLNDYLDWIPFETVPPIPSSCCISYKKAEKLASHYQKTGDIVCFEKQVSKCIYGKCKIPALYGELYKGPNCSLGAVSPIGCLEVVELTILRMIEICEKMFLICVVAYVIAEIIMGITLLIYSRPVQVKSVFFNGTLKIINGSRS